MALIKSEQMSVCCRFDDQHDFEPPLLSEGIWPRAHMVDSCRKFFGRLDEDHTLIFNLLCGYKGSIEEFVSLRRSVWPDSLFYRPDFSRQRMRLAVGIACNLNNAWVAAPMCRSVLGLDNDTAQNNMPSNIHTDTGGTIFHGLAIKIGRTYGTRCAGEWHTLVRDVLRHFPDIGLLNQHDTMLSRSGVALATQTPLSLLIWESLNGRLRFAQQHVNIRSTNTTAVLAGCEKSILAWLADLHESGIDLRLYGENEKEHFRHPELFPEDEVYEKKCTLVYGARLVNFYYGRLPAEWKFWWTEPSDEFSGDFWSFVESKNQEKAMSIPGAWID